MKRLRSFSFLLAYLVEYFNVKHLIRCYLIVVFICIFATSFFCSTHDFLLLQTMNDQLKFTEAEELVSCPYNIAHTCPRKRLAFHLIKCRKQHLGLAKELKECIHNIQHRVPRPEYQVNSSYIQFQRFEDCIHDE